MIWALSLLNTHRDDVGTAAIRLVRRLLPLRRRMGGCCDRDCTCVPVYACIRLSATLCRLDSLKHFFHFDADLCAMRFLDIMYY